MAMFLAEAMKASVRLGKTLGSGTKSATIGTASAIAHPLRTTGRAAMYGGKTFASGAAISAVLAGRAGLAAGGIGMRVGRRFGPRAYRATNAFSKLTLGASVPQIGAVTGLGIGAYATLADRPVETAQQVGRFVGSMGEQMKAASRPTYGSTVFQQSVQGLTFGLNSRRTR